MEMMQMKDGSEFAFSKVEYLRPQQISSYFTKLAMEQQKLEKEDYKPAEEARCKQELKSEILKRMK